MTPSGLQQVHLTQIQDSIVIVLTSNILNPATPLPTPTTDTEMDPLHKCMEVLQLTPTSFPHIHDSALRTALLLISYL